MEMIEVGMREQDQIDGWQMVDFQTGSFDALQQKNPVGEVGIDQDI